MPTKAVTAVLIGTTAFVFFSLFHMRFLQRFIDHDVVVYTINTYAGYKEPVFNPHHIHFETSARYFHDYMKEAWGTYGFTDFMLNMRIRSILAAATGFAAIILLVRRLTGSLFWGILCGVLTTMTHGYMSYASRFDTAIFPAAWFPVMLAAALPSRFTVLRAALLGVVFTLGILLHQYMGLACITLALPLLMPDRLFGANAKKAPANGTIRDFFKRVHFLAGAAVVTFVLTAGAYLYAGVGIYNLPYDKPHPQQNKGIWNHLIFQHWIITYLTVDDWGQGIKSFHPEEPARGLTDAFVSQKSMVPKYNRNFKFDFHPESPLDAETAPFTWSLYFVCFTLGAGILLVLPLCRRYGRAYAGMLLSLPVFVWLGAYWEPFYYEFWIVPEVILCLLGTLALHFLSEWMGARLGSVARLPAVAVASAFTVLITSHNMIWWLLPHSKHEYCEGLDPWKDDPGKIDRISGRWIYKNPNDPAPKDDVFR
ncbi:MAG: hypothetical protein HY042_10365 [Spirochaetia bacterium]|nr:hypothetical protein [Spirochaetia bacterium]